MQLGPNVVGRIRIAFALIASDQHATGDHPGDTGQANPLP
jgi:hypothetical protein